jgi:hypothetical protein
MAGRCRTLQQIVSTPVIGRLLAHTVTLPIGTVLAEAGARGVFLPQSMPDGFVENSATRLLLRRASFCQCVGPGDAQGRHGGTGTTLR